MSNEEELSGIMGVNFTLVELTRIKLEPDEVLSAKLYGDDYDPETLTSLKQHLSSVFPNNKVMVFMMPNGSDIQLEAIKAEVKEEVKQDCSTVNYCNSCNCGKKAAAEQENK